MKRKTTSAVATPPIRVVQKLGPTMARLRILCPIPPPKLTPGQRAASITMQRGSGMRSKKSIFGSIY